jgi:hypothetical protein
MRRRMERVMGELVMDKNEFGDALMMGHDMDMMVLGDSTGWNWGERGSYLALLATAITMMLTHRLAACSWTCDEGWVCLAR